MGVINETAVFMHEALSSGVSFRSVLTLGRQTMYVDRGTGERLSRRNSWVESEYADEFLKGILGAEEITAIDNSNYEGAQVVHDLNLPIPEAFEQRFDAMVDGGTLEHVFNFPGALTNCMKMVRVGGRLFIFTPANNMLGHGFYQFSPELFYRALSPETGFEIERMQAVPFKYPGTEFGSLGKRYDVVDPAKVRSRVMLINAHPVLLMIQARKLQHIAEPFATPPQQSDYTRAWKGGDDARNLSRPYRVLRAVGRLMPKDLQAFFRNQYQKRFVCSLRNRAHYLPTE